MFDGFALDRIDLGEVVLRVRHGGVGPPILRYSEEEHAHGGEEVSAIAYLATPQLWFESFQNWQSEFMSIGALVVLSIFLRQKGSSESKPVDAPVQETGG